MISYQIHVQFMSLCILTLTSCQAQPHQADQQKMDRRPAVAGSFYPASEAELNQQLADFFHAAKKFSGTTPLALIVPHAGYIFSGQTAAFGYRQLDRSAQFEHIFLIGSSHTMYFQGASVYTQGDFLTPLGRVKLDPLAAELVKKYPDFNDNPEPHLKEHSLEVQLPFLQYWLENEFSIVPIVLGGEDKASFQKIAGILKPWFNDKNLFIISSDFSHYPAYEEATSCDARMAESILSNSPDEFLKTRRKIENEGISNLATAICGWTSVYTLLNITADQEDIIYKKIHYSNSGDAPMGSGDRVVGYHAISVSGNLNSGEGNGFNLRSEEKVMLLVLARKSLSEHVTNPSQSEMQVKNLSPGMLMPAGAFVTLKKKGQLRGCIGNFQTEAPLYQTIQDMSIAAGTKDPRFSAVRKEELPDIEFEISVLSPLKKINTIDEFVLGKHGIYIKQGSRTGTFLPQVADETGWTLEEFLGHCSRDKAGIGWEGWKTADLYIYEALVFGEHEFNLR